MLRVASSIMGAAFCLGGCAQPATPARPWVPHPAPDLGAVVARVGEVPVFAAEVAGQAARTGKTPRAALLDLIELHLLAERVRSHWPPDAPAVQQLEREMIVQRLIERDFEANNRLEDMPDAAVRVLYDGVVDKFVHPRLYEVATLGVTPGKKAAPEAWAEARRTIRELKAIVDAHKGEKTPEALQAILTDPRWPARHVQFFRFMQAGDKPYSARFGAEVAKLGSPGETALIEDEYGVYITRYISERPPQNRTFEMVKKDLREGHYPRWRQQRFLEFTQQLMARHEVEIHAGPLPTPPGSQAPPGSR